MFSKISNYTSPIDHYSNSSPVTLARVKLIIAVHTSEI